MSPIAAIPVSGSGSKDFKRESTMARLLGSGMFATSLRVVLDGREGCWNWFWIGFELISFSHHRIRWYR